MSHTTKAFILTCVLGAIASLFCLIIVLTNEPTFLFVGGFVGAYPLYRWYYHLLHTVDDKDSNIKEGKVMVFGYLIHDNETDVNVAFCYSEKRAKQIATDYLKQYFHTVTEEDVARSFDANFNRNTRLMIEEIEIID